MPTVGRNVPRKDSLAKMTGVPMADRIVVLKDGEVVEDGSHEYLLEKQGLYSELFAMQAAGYR